MKIETDCEFAFFVSSSGHCTFDCSYCIITPIAKKQPPIVYEDIRFLLDTLGIRRAFLSFFRCRTPPYCECNMLVGLGNTGEVEVSEARAA